jgi:DTW domain-containing protein YfiP
LKNSSRLCLVIHRDEDRKTTNTGRLAADCLSGSRIVVHGKSKSPTLDPGAQMPRLILFPCEEAEELTRSHVENGPIELLVPDGTWRQATKMTRRIPWLNDARRVSLPTLTRTRYRLREEAKLGGLATLEAIAQAFGILEGPEVQDALEHVFRMKVERTLYSRGVLQRENVFGGVPEGVVRHDPRPAVCGD